MATVRFVLRTDKLCKDGRSPLQMVYQVQGQRKYFNTAFKCFEANWNNDAQAFIYRNKTSYLKYQEEKQLPAIDFKLLATDEEIKTLNRKLIRLKTDVEEIEEKFKLDKTVFTAEMVIDKLKESKSPTTKKQAPSSLLFDFIDQYIQDHEAMRVKGSLVVYKSLKRHLQDFQRHKNITVTFENIDSAFFQKFETFLIKGEGTTTDKKGNVVPRKPINNITVAKQLSTAKTFLGYARERGIKVPDIKYKIKRENDLEVIALTNDELASLYNLDLSASPALDRVRDVFCFSCFTGLRYSDLKQLRREHIQDDIISLTTIKTTNRTTIPLTPLSKAILDKYSEQQLPLPVISNQKSNKSLEKICQLAEINTPVEIVRKFGARRDVNIYPKYELVRMHCGRKTFVTLSLERKIPAEVVMTLSGHKDHRSFSRYVKVTEDRKKAAMQQAWTELKPNLLKAV